MINIREIPFVRLIIPLILGIVCSNLIIPAKNIITLVLFLLSFAFYRQHLSFKYKWLFGSTITVLLFFIGYQLAFFHNELNTRNHFSKYLHDNNLLIGKITEVPKATAKSTKLKMTVTAVVDSVNKKHACHGNLLVYLKRDSTNDTNIAYGDEIIFKGNIQKIQPPKNPNAFDYQKYLHYQNIHYQTFLPHDQYQVISSNNGNFFIKKSFVARAFFLKTLKKYIPEPDELAVASAIIIGYREAIPDEIKNAYAETGAIHVLAVSGLHVGIILMILSFLLIPFFPKTTFQRVVKISIILLGIWLFALITGASPSVIRAATMFSLLLIGINIQRSTNIYNTIAGSAFFILLLNPFLLHNIGFQLSYIAVLGIVFFQPKIYKLLTVKTKFFNYIWKLTTVSAAAQLSTLPLTVFYFHKLTTLFWLSGLIVVPAAFLILFLGLLMFVIEVTIPILNIPIGFALFWVIKIVNKIIFGIQQIPYSFIDGLWITKFSMFVFVGIILFLSIYFLQKKVKWLYYALSILFFAAISYSFSNINIIKKQEIAFYNIKNETLIDFFEGKKLITLSSYVTKDKSENYAAKNHRWSKGIKKQERYGLKEDISILKKHFCKQKNLIQFHDTKIAIIDTCLSYNSKPTIDVDILLLRNNATVTIENVQQHYNFKTLIIDNTNKPKQVKKWKIFCEKENITYHDLHEKAYLYEQK